MTRRYFPLAAFTAACAVFSAACGVHLEDVPRRALAQTSFVYAADDTVITELHAVEDRVVLPTSQIPDWIRDAAVAIEDRRFYQHHGIDGRAIIRASYVNLRDGTIEEGGSTITQQLVKNLYTGGDRTLARKLSEASLAWQLEDRLSKEEILTRYLNTVYFGQGAYGVQAAARTFFDVDAADLSLAQSALLAGLITSPGHFDPYEYPRRALGRRRVVLRLMHEFGMITTAQRREARRAPVDLHPVTTLGRYDYPYFVDYLKEWFLTQPRLRRDARGSLQAPVHRRPPDPHDAAAGGPGSVATRRRFRAVLPERPLRGRDRPRPAHRLRSGDGRRRPARLLAGSQRRPREPGDRDGRDGATVRFVLQAVRARGCARGRLVTVGDLPRSLDAPSSPSNRARSGT